MARLARMDAGDGRCVRAAPSKTEEERERLTGGPGEEKIYFSFFFFGCDSKSGTTRFPGLPASSACWPALCTTLA